MRHFQFFIMVISFSFAFSSSAIPSGSSKPHGETETPVYSSLVYPGADGRLVYVPDAKGDIIPDFSYAGYGGGGIKLPDVPVKTVVKPTGINDAARVQQAIDTVSALLPDKHGFRGTVLLKRGWYDLEKPLTIGADGVVLCGEGQDDDGTILYGRWTKEGKLYDELSSNATLVFVKGESAPEIIEITARKIIDSYVPLGARSFRVISASDFKTGDTVYVRRYGGRKWFTEIGLEYDRWKGHIDSHDFDRIVTRVSGDTMFVDAPITIAIEDAWGGGDVVKYRDNGRISNVGIEHLRGISWFDSTIRTNEYGNIDRTPYYGAEYYSDEDHYWNFIKFENTCNAWVRNVTGLHFAGAVVNIGDGLKWATVQDCVSLEPVSVCGGGRRFPFHISGQLCLVQRCFSDRGRHSFILGGLMTCGPNVFLDCTATRPYSSSEPHSNLVVGSLYDNVIAPIAFRYAKSNPGRWMGVNNFMWNCEGMFIVQKPPTTQNYSIGHIGIHAMIFNRVLIEYSWPDGYIESLDEHVSPRSLYIKQLEDRLGKRAVQNVTTVGQR